MQRGYNVFIAKNGNSIVAHTDEIRPRENRRRRRMANCILLMILQTNSETWPHRMKDLVVVNLHG